MSLKSLVATGTKLWLDSVDPELVDKNIALVRRYFEEQRAKHPTTMSQSAVA